MTELPDWLHGRTPEQVLDFLRTAGDDELAAQVASIGPAELLAALFGAWAARVPAAAGRSPGVLAFELDDAGEVHRWGLAVSAAGAEPARAPARSRAVVRTSLLRFLRVAAGAQDPKILVLTGRLRLGGDLLWAVATLRGLQQP